MFILYDDKFAYLLTPSLALTEENLKEYGLYEYVFRHYEDWADAQNTNPELELRRDRVVGIMVIHRSI